ncbi:MAG TPA: hypothetical protein VES20_18610, partial [Bryobacteraceae bacterium]|nr:hypothetical protein [Bryobacteraceae bacterium]
MIPELIRCPAARGPGLLVIGLALTFAAPSAAVSRSGERMWLAPSDKVLFVGPVAVEQRHST